MSDFDEETRTQFLKEFISEAIELITSIENDILGLEASKENPGIINNIYRCLHSLKGSSSFFDLDNIQRISHKCESLLSLLKEKKLILTDNIVGILLKSIDVLKEMIMSTTLGKGYDIGHLLNDLDYLIDGTFSGKCSGKVSETVSGVKPLSDKTHNVDGDKIYNEEELKNKLRSETLTEEELIFVVEDIKKAGDRSPFYEVTYHEKKRDIYNPASSSVVEKNVSNGKQIHDTHKSAKIENRSIRLDVDVLDKLLELVGEVVLERNQIVNKFKGDTNFKNLSASITGLHKNIIQIRMVSIGTLFEKYQRIVRDISIKMGKNIDLVIEGKDIELDKTIIENISDPLTHLVRNACDHGIELPQIRLNSGKSSVGKLHLRAFNESGQIVIEVEDDGAGIDPEVVKSKAIKKNLISVEEANEFSESEILNLIFYPGFSTKENISEISGRGVGMDVVKTNFEKIGSSFEIHSVKGRGTIFSARIPLTQAIVNSSVISALIVEFSGIKFAIPQSGVNEVMKITGYDYENNIKKINGNLVFMLREKLIPLINLTNILNIKRINFTEKIIENISNILLILQYKQDFFGIIVDNIIASEEIVVKRLPASIKEREIYAGSTILGNGEISLILDLKGIISKSSLNFSRKDRNPGKSENKNRILSDDKQKILLFSLSKEEYFGIPMNLVSEIERFSISDIKKIGRKEYVELHGLTVPLLKLEEILSVSKPEFENNNLFVIIPSKVKYPTGIVAGKIINTIEISEKINIIDENKRGVLGTFFFKEHIATLLDIYGLLLSDNPELYREKVGDEIKSLRILLAEDTVFFRQLISQYLNLYGISNITIAKNGREALDKLLPAPEEYDIVISDIDMPLMNGYELVSNIRRDKKLQNIPVMALSSLSEEKYVKMGFDAGFDAYEVKIDKDRVFESIRKLTKLKG